METGFLNPIQDDEHFPTNFYGQESGLDESEHILFGEMIVPEVLDYDNLWQNADINGVGSHQEESNLQKDEFQRLLYEWQHHLTYMQETDNFQQMLPVEELTSGQPSTVFTSLQSSNSLTPAAKLAIDELFPLELTKESPTHTDTSEENEAPSEVIDEVNIKDESEALPLLMAGDLTSLLEQFEATEQAECPQQITEEVIAPPSPPRPSTQTIRDALPEEVINRIKASRENHKKHIAVIPAMPNKKQGKAATRMQDAGVALSRNKLLKLVTGGSSGESVRLDHDYCSNEEAPSSSSGSTVSTPEYNLQEASPAPESSSRKDSGLESGDLSEEDNKSRTVCDHKTKIMVKTSTGLRSMNIIPEKSIVVNSASVMRTDVPMMSVLKKNNVKKEDNIKLENNGHSYDNCSAASVVIKSEVPDCSSGEGVVDNSGVKKKRKLNLEEYRVRREERDRIRSQESSRASTPVSCSTPPTNTLSTCKGTNIERPIMQSVEVQTQTSDIIDLTTSESPPAYKADGRSRESRNESKRKSYLRLESSSSSSCSLESELHRTRTKRRSRSNKRRRNSVSRMWSRSRSRSSSRSRHSSRSRSRSGSRSREGRQKWRSRSPHKYNSRSRNSNQSDRDYYTRDWSWNRSRSPARRNQDFGPQEKVRQVEERRVIYVGRIDEGTTKADLRRRFQQFGPIIDISVHFRERGDNYGFVTFAYKADAYKAVEHGNDDRTQPHYDLCFGGRRAFCKQRYADLDGMASSIQHQYSVSRPMPRSDDSFDSMLHELKAQLRKRSSV